LGLTVGRAAAGGPTGAYGVLLPQLIAGGIEFRRLGSGALGVAETAAGLNDGYMEMHSNAWDGLAGIILVRKADGWASDFLAGDAAIRSSSAHRKLPRGFAWR
jgi:myo-inositol-1(or 4)-monophosphatase